MIEEGRIDTAPWVTHRLSLADVPAAFAGLREQPGLIKAMIEVGDADA
jgi:threonine dehydrogenase-like Zn-dependent dehydrogenase